jgi:hypothetical protein
MKTTLLIATVLSGLTSGLPTSMCTPPTAPFFLVTTSSRSCSDNSTLLPDAAATSTYAPLHQTTLLIRTILPGYQSLPNFTLTDGTLETVSDGPFGAQTQLYNATTPAAGEQLGFVAAANPTGGFTLEDGYLLAVGGDTESWTLCTVSGEPVVST